MHGGGVYVDEGSATSSGGQIIGNTASDDGGGIHNHNGTVNLVNTTVSHNTASSGGGLYIEDGTAALTFTTVASNTVAGGGGGIHFISGTITVRNSILAFNGVADCDGATLTSSGYSLEYGDTCGLTAATDLTNTKPLLGSLVNDGGSLIHPLLPGSPAIDAGLCIAGTTTDQRGAPRPQVPGGKCDIGAYEFYDPDAPVPLTSVSINGPVDGAIGESYTFTATVSPPLATLPITYGWQATGQSATLHTGGLSDTAAFTWTVTGAQAITVTATNAVNMVSTAVAFTIRYRVYLPLAVRDF
jgi:hypothetical protein